MAGSNLASQFIWIGIIAEQVRVEKEHSDWFPSLNGPNFPILTAKMDRLNHYTECPQGMTCLGFGRVSFFSSS